MAEVYGLSLSASSFIALRRPTYYILHFRCYRRTDYQSVSIISPNYVVFSHQVEQFKLAWF